jgi:hypothetical protein
MMKLTKALLFLPFLAGIIPFSPTVAAQEDPKTEELAKKRQNPVSNLISLPLQNNFTPSSGADDGIQNVLNIQPVIPVKVGPVNLINRIILPIVTQPAVVSGGDGATGLGDINYQLFFSPSKPSRFVWGGGPIVIFPTGTDTILGQGKLSLGPTAVALALVGPWVGGLLINNVWSVAGDETRPDVNQMLMQPFINYNFSKGWFLSTSPILTANWEASNDNRWTVPVGGGGGRVFKIGSQPVNLNTQFFYNALRPQGVGPFTWRLSFTFLFPK